MNAPLFDFWREIPGLPGYFVSRDGQVRSEKTKGRSRCPTGMLRLRVGTNGYVRFNMTKDGAPGTFEVHRAIALAFHGEPPFPGAHAAHDDGDRLNNTDTNVLWKTPAENAADKVRHGVPRKAWLPAELFAKAKAAHEAGATLAAISREIGYGTRSLRLRLNGPQPSRQPPREAAGCAERRAIPTAKASHVQ